jgi:predicted transcriptional regulator
MKITSDYLVPCFRVRYMDVCPTRHLAPKNHDARHGQANTGLTEERGEALFFRLPLGVVKAMNDSSNHVELAAEIVSAYVSNNSVPSSELPALLSDVHAAIVRVASGAQQVVVEAAKPAVPPKKSITSDYIVCLEDGRKFKSLKRHLRTQYNLSPEEYREKWGLPSDYPMVAPAYAKARSALAKQMGLGQQRRRRK